jgi:signal transduction histidine kinase/CheY-like chemotaxis protein
MHRLFALPRFPDDGQADARRAYAVAWLLVLAALLMGLSAASVQRTHAVAWLLAAASVAAACFLMMAVILHDSLQRRKLLESKLVQEASSKLEGQLRQARKLESLGRMAGHMAHDFNNLLTVINGFSDLLLSRTQAGDPRRKDLQAIREAGEKAAGLVRQLVTVSGRQLAQPRALKLSAIVAGSRAMLEDLLGPDIELAIALEPALGSVMADPGQIRQVLTNLAVNARDAMLGGGKLSIEAANVDLDEVRAREMAVNPGSYVLLAVSDTGAGIGEDAMAHLFEPFFTTKEAASAVGLGLAEVYGIVKQSGGRIKVSSEAGKGSAFRIYLPRVPEPPSPSETGAAASADDRKAGTEPDIGSYTVLIVDDESSVRDLIRQALAPHGCTILEAGNGQEALSAAAVCDSKIDIVIVDFVMPGLNGLDLALEMERTSPALKTLYVSSAIESIGMVSMLRHAPGRVLLKPFTAEQVVERVMALVRDRA